MFEHKQLISAVGLGLLALPGCTLPDFLAASFTQSSTAAHAPGDTPVVEASLLTVANTATKVLQEMQIQAIASEEQERVVIHCTTAKGNHFDLKLSSVRDPNANGSEHTHVAIEWEGPPDRGTNIRLLAGLRVLSAR